MENKEAVETKQTQTETTEQTPKTYTQEEVDALIKAESDRKVTKALQTVEAKNKKKVQEAERLANMSAEQKYEYELSAREAAIEQKEKELALAENRNVCSKILAEKGISLDLVNFVVAEDADIMDSNIKALEKAFKQSVKTEVEKRLTTNVPKQNLPTNEVITKEQFKKMSISELTQLREEQPELFAELSK